MRSRRIFFAAVAASLAFVAHAQQKPDATVRAKLEGFLEVTAESCPKFAESVADTAAGGEVRTMLGVPSLQYQTQCVCQPRKVRALLDSLPAERLAASSRGENGMPALYKAEIEAPCRAEELHFQFEGNSCIGFKLTETRAGIGQAAFCGCMSKALAGWPDADSSAISDQIVTYEAQVRVARGGKAPPPEQPALVGRYLHALQECGGGEEARK